MSDNKEDADASPKSAPKTPLLLQSIANAKDAKKRISRIAQTNESAELRALQDSLAKGDREGRAVRFEDDVAPAKGDGAGRPAPSRPEQRKLVLLRSPKHRRRMEAAAAQRRSELKEYEELRGKLGGFHRHGSQEASSVGAVEKREAEKRIRELLKNRSFRHDLRRLHRRGRTTKEAKQLAGEGLYYDIVRSERSVCEDTSSTVVWGSPRQSESRSNAWMDGTKFCEEWCRKVSLADPADYEKLGVSSEAVQWAADAEWDSHDFRWSSLRMGVKHIRHGNGLLGNPDQNPSRRNRYPCNKQTYEFVVEGQFWDNEIEYVSNIGPLTPVCPPNTRMPAAASITHCVDRLIKFGPLPEVDGDLYIFCGGGIFHRAVEDGPKKTLVLESEIEEFFTPFPGIGDIYLVTNAGLVIDLEKDDLSQVPHLVSDLVFLSNGQMRKVHVTTKFVMLFLLTRLFIPMRADSIDEVLQNHIRKDCFSRTYRQSLYWKDEGYGWMLGAVALLGKSSLAIHRGGKPELMPVRDEDVEAAAEEIITYAALTDVHSEGLDVNGRKLMEQDFTLLKRLADDIVGHEDSVRGAIIASYLGDPQGAKILYCSYEGHMIHGRGQGSVLVINTEIYEPLPDQIPELDLASPVDELSLRLESDGTAVMCGRRWQVPLNYIEYFNEPGFMGDLANATPAFFNLMDIHVNSNATLTLLPSILIGKKTVSKFVLRGKDEELSQPRAFRVGLMWSSVPRQIDLLLYTLQAIRNSDEEHAAYKLLMGTTKSRRILCPVPSEKAAYKSAETYVACCLARPVDYTDCLRAASIAHSAKMNMTSSAYDELMISGKCGQKCYASIRAKIRDDRCTVLPFDEDNLFLNRVVAMEVLPHNNGPRCEQYSQRDAVLLGLLVTLGTLFSIFLGTNAIFLVASIISYELFDHEVTLFGWFERYRGETTHSINRVVVTVMLATLQSFDEAGLTERGLSVGSISALAVAGILILDLIATRLFMSGNALVWSGKEGPGRGSVEIEGPKGVYSGYTALYNGKSLGDGEIGQLRVSLTREEWTSILLCAPSLHPYG
uniref:Uncharacterized protein n=1 Tax=Pinguiococcus pyrenoidosus TaxID=172671 RepID=A0A7R9Y9B8_9STRA|mmetsp:Transcript_13616/g.50721  ORF Transcript_13616/g.50721 Transcript_13616/m.50721 type:complete len:1057 (+) Transcript_13616:89-3259(+)|eukprot:scaffold2778_cov254-Pinguiococcus_pyrenoidosus.AAC.1